MHVTIELKGTTDRAVDSMDAQTRCNIVSRNLQEDKKSFGLSHEDAEDREQWKLRIRGQPANLCFYVYVYVIYRF